MKTIKGFSVGNKTEPMTVKCGGCNSERGNRLEGQVSIFVCAGCQGLIGRCYLGEFYGFVRPYFYQGPDRPQMYYDFVTLGTTIERHHGWFDPETKMITQVG